jgi:hypothetical protein
VQGQLAKGHGGRWVVQTIIAQDPLAGGRVLCILDTRG